MQSATYSDVKYSNLLEEESGSAMDMTSAATIEMTSGLDYKSIFSYANYNDLEEMGYKGLGRHRTHLGSRYKGFTYSDQVAERKSTEEGAHLHERKRWPPAHKSCTVSGDAQLSWNIIESVIIVFSYVLLITTMPFSLLFSIKFVRSFERMVVFRLGRVQALRTSGATFVLPCIDTYKMVDMRTKAFNVPPLQAITTDQGLIELGATVYYRIKDALAAVVAVQDWNKSTRTLAQTMLQRKAHKERMCDITNPHRRRVFAAQVQEELGRCTFVWGIEVTEVEVSDIKVIKDAENQAANVIQHLMKSSVGKQMFDAIKPAVQDYYAKQKGTNGLTAIPGHSGSIGSIQSLTDSSSDGNQLIDISSAEDISSPTSSDNAQMGMELDLDKLVSTLADVINRDVVAEVGCVYEVHCTGLGMFYIDLRNGDGAVGLGRCPSELRPDVCFELASGDLISILTGQLSPVEAYLGGRVSIQGDTGAAMRLKILGQHLVARGRQ